MRAVTAKVAKVLSITREKKRSYAPKPENTGSVDLAKVSNNHPAAIPGIIIPRAINAVQNA